MVALKKSDLEEASEKVKMSQRIIESGKRTPVQASRLMTPEQCAAFLQIEVSEARVWAILRLW
jgi:hypothetical protein